MIHFETHFKETGLLRDVVIGMSDGLTVPFALTAGLSGAIDSNRIILTAGIAEIIAGSIAMGLGGYLAGKTQEDHFRGELKREYEEINAIPEQEKQEVREIFARYGFSKPTQDMIVNEISLDKNNWVDFMMAFELGLSQPNQKEASKSACRIGFSYAVGGLIPLSAYWLTSSPQRGLFYSSILTIACLGLFGFLKAKWTQQPPLAGAIYTILIGAVAATAAYGVARLFS